MNRIWWKEEVIYQIYPRSFKDSNGDGIGDINGIISKLDYLKELGIDIIWLGPVYDSPNDDNGYDIRDYYKIHEEFGTLDEWEHLLKEIHKRDMKLIMDMVVNHSSDEHTWFIESRKSKDNPYRDYYFWKDGVDDLPPNNWPSFFGGSAWEKTPETDQYYLHLFTKKQPDLNWENPKVRDEIKKILKFWLDKGIDGFRMDVIPLVSKRLDFASTELTKFNDIVDQVYSNGPKVHDYIKEIYRDVFSKYDCMTVGEGPGITKDVGLNYVDESNDELNMIFHLDHMFLGHGLKGRFDPEPYTWVDIKRIFYDWDHAMGDKGWISIFMDNHDFPRMVSRFGNDDAYHAESAKMLAMMILTLRGTPCIYQGSEIGMTNVLAHSMDEFRDVETHNMYHQLVGTKYTESEFIEMVNKQGRDNVRTPMQWDDTAFAGFSKAEPWIGVNPNYRKINVKACLEDSDSIFYFYKKLLAYRKENETLIYGNMHWYEIDHPTCFIYERVLGNKRLLIVLNHTDEEQAWPSSLFGTKSLVLSNYNNPSEGSLNPWEGRLYEIINNA